MKEVLSRCGFKCFAERELPEKSTRGEYNYLLVIHYKNGKKTIKIGTTNNMAHIGRISPSVGFLLTSQNILL